VIRQCLKESVIKVGNLRASRDFTYVDDMTDAMIAALEISNIEGEIINIGTSKPWKMEDLLRLIKKETCTEKKDVVLDKSRLGPDDVKMLVADSKKARNILGWKPQTTFKEGIQKPLNGTVTTKKCGDTRNTAGNGATDSCTSSSH